MGMNFPQASHNKQEYLDRVKTYTACVNRILLPSGWEQGRAMYSIDIDDLPSHLLKEQSNDFYEQEVKQFSRKLHYRFDLHSVYNRKILSDLLYDVTVEQVEVLFTSLSDEEQAEWLGDL